MTRQLGGEQRDGHGARLDRGEETGDVVQTLRSQDRHPIPSGSEPLDLRADGAHPRPEPAPGQLVGDSVLRAGVVQVAIRHGVADVGDVAFDKRDQGDRRRQRDVACAVENVLDLPETLLSGWLEC